MLDPVFLENRIPELQKALDGLGPEALLALVRELVRYLETGEGALLERISAGHALGLAGDPRLDPLAPQMCPVPRGSFWMGIEEAECARVARQYGIPVGWLAKATPLHEVELDAFEIARFPVTVGEYARFLQEAGLEQAPPGWPDGRPEPFRSSHPVHGVGWQESLLYAEWVSERTGLHYRIPTEAEWECAARSSDRRTFPWGDAFEPGRCNTREGGIGTTTPVGTYPGGASPCGALDMAGNVEELVADLYWPYPGSHFQDGDFGTYRITRGGVYSLDADLARCDRRHGTAHAGPTGFRLCRSAADEWLGRSSEAEGRAR